MTRRVQDGRNPGHIGPGKLYAFRLVWEHVSASGRCDEIEGAEYRRVLGEWIAERYPQPLEQFILRRANIGPCGEEGVHDDARQ